MASFPPLTGKEQSRRTNIARGVRRSAEHRQCPQCNRKAALKYRSDGDYWEKTCRYCGYEKGGYIKP